MMTVELFLLIMVIALLVISRFLESETDAQTNAVAMALIILAILVLDVIVHLPSMFTGSSIAKELGK